MKIKNLFLPLAIAFAGLFVTSCANNEQVLTSITLGSTELEVPMIGGEFSVPVNVTMGLVTATSSVDWIATCWQPDTKTLLVSVDENTEYKAGPRTGSITLDNEFCKVTLTVNQLFEDETYGTMSLYYADGEPFHPRYSRNEKDIKDPDFGFDAQGELEEQYAKNHRDHHQDEKCIAFFEVRTNQHEWDVKVLDKDNNELGEDAWLTVTRGTGASANYFVVNKVKPTNKTVEQVAKVVVSPVGTALNNQYAGEVIWVHQDAFELYVSWGCLDQGLVKGNYDPELQNFVEQPVIVFPSLAHFLPIAFDQIPIYCQNQDGWQVSSSSSFVRVQKGAYVADNTNSGNGNEPPIVGQCPCVSTKSGVTMINGAVHLVIDDNHGERRSAVITIVANNAGVEVPLTINLEQYAKTTLEVTPEPVLFAQTGHEVQNFVVNTNTPWGGWMAQVWDGTKYGAIEDYLDPFWDHNWVNEMPPYGGLTPSVNFSITGWDGKNPTALALGTEDENNKFYNLKGAVFVAAGFGNDIEFKKFLVEQERKAVVFADWTDAELFNLFGETWAELVDDQNTPNQNILDQALQNSGTNTTKGDGLGSPKDIIVPLLKPYYSGRLNEAFLQFATEEYDNTELAIILSNFDWEPTFVNEDGTEADWVTLEKVENVINLKDKFHGLTATLVKISVEDNTAGIARSAKINLTTTGAITEGNVDKTALIIDQEGEEVAMISASWQNTILPSVMTLKKHIEVYYGPDLDAGVFPWQGAYQYLEVKSNYSDFDKTPGWKAELVDEVGNPIEWATFDYLGAEIVDNEVINFIAVKVDENNGLEPKPRKALVRLTAQGGVEDNTSVFDLPFEQQAGLDFAVNAEKHIIFLDDQRWANVPIMVSNEDYDCLKFTKIEVSSDCLAGDPIDDSGVSETQAPYQDGLDEKNRKNYSLVSASSAMFKWWQHTDIGEWHFARIFNPGEKHPADKSWDNLYEPDELETVPALDQYIFVKANHRNLPWEIMQLTVPDSNETIDMGVDAIGGVPDRAVKLVITGEFRDNNDNVIVTRTAEFWVIQLGQHYNPKLPVGDYLDFRPVPTPDPTPDSTTDPIVELS